MRRGVVVEDEPLLSRALWLLGREYEFEAHPGPSAEVAFAVISREPAFDATVTDIRLPGISGQEMANRLRPRLIALSGDIRVLPSLRHFAVKLLKPCRPVELVAAIRGDT